MNLEVIAGDHLFACDLEVRELARQRASTVVSEWGVISSSGGD